MQGPPGAALFIFNRKLQTRSRLRAKKGRRPLNNGDSILYHGAILTETVMKNIKFDHNKDKGRPGSVWWDLVMGLTKTVSIRMVEEKFFVQSKNDEETIFDLVLRTGLAPDFQA